MATRKTALTEEEKKQRQEIKEALGDKDGVSITQEKTTGEFYFQVADKSLRNNAGFKRDFYRHFGAPLKWNKEKLSFVAPAEFSSSIAIAARTAREYSAEIIHIRATWLAYIKRSLSLDVELGFNERLQSAMSYRRDNPSEVAELPPLPKAFETPVFNDVYAGTRAGDYQNGPVIAANRFFVVQHTGGGNLKDDKISTDPTHYLTFHSTDKFLHTARDWASPIDEVLTHVLGNWREGQWKSIEYNEHGKATIFDYDPQYHSTRARKAQQEFAQAPVEERAVNKPTPQANKHVRKSKPMEMGACYG